jgi:hypothetical protein
MNDESKSLKWLHRFEKNRKSRSGLIEVEALEVALSRLSITRCGSWPGDLSIISRRGRLIGREFARRSRRRRRRNLCSERESASPGSRREGVIIYFCLRLRQSVIRSLRIRAHRQCSEVMLFRSREHSLAHRRITQIQSQLNFPQLIHI